MTGVLAFLGVVAILIWVNRRFIRPRRGGEARKAAPTWQQMEKELEEFNAHSHDPVSHPVASGELSISEVRDEQGALSTPRSTKTRS